MIRIYKITFPLVLLIITNTLFAQSTDGELRDKAEGLFETGQYAEALPIYSQLLSLNTQDPEYNFRFGACQLFVSSDKESPLKYLAFAVHTANPPPLAHYYYGYGLHLNYRFDKAIGEYQKYKEVAGKKDRESKLVDAKIQMCVNGKQLVSSFTDISVVHKEVLPRSDFFRNYDLSGFGGKIIVKPDEFMSEEDKKRDGKFLMYFQQEANMIYYASYSAKNETGKDIFSITKLPTGEWSSPHKLGSVINSPADEDYPFIHPDGKTLYFASKGHNTMGGYDIFKSTQKADGTWTQPVNMEFAINTPWDDFMFITDMEETSAWFASNRETDNKSVTVYKIGMQRVPLDLTLIKGVFYADGSRKAKITVEDMVQGKIVGVYESDRQLGNYLLDLRGSGKYKFIVEAEESEFAHTGTVEVPRLKGLNQWAQEMRIVDNNGQEQLQIINLFEEQITDETLLTAEILKKQASLDVNASVLDLQQPIASETTGGQETSTVSDPQQAISEVGATIRAMESNQRELAEKAANAFSIAIGKKQSSGAENLAEAAIATELAEMYQQRAGDKAAEIQRAKTLEQQLLSAEPGSDAFTAFYNQFTAAYKAPAMNQPAVEKEIISTLESRMELTSQLAAQKEAEVLQIDKDIAAIDGEIAYYQKEIENSKDKAVIDELNAQIDAARRSVPVKQEALDKAKNELAVLEQQASAGESYMAKAAEMTSGIASGALAPAVSTGTVAMPEIQATEAELMQQMGSDLALSVLVTPSASETKTSEALAAARREEVNNAASPETGSKEPATEPASEAQNTEEESGTPVDLALTADGGEGVNPDLENLNEAIAEGGEPRNVEPVEGNYDVYFESLLAEMGDDTLDLVTAEIQRAEIYDRWAVSVQNEIAGKEQLSLTAATPEEKTALQGEIAVLKNKLAEKQSLAANSYATLAALNDEQAREEGAAGLDSLGGQEDGTIEIPSPEIAVVDVEETSKEDASDPVAIADKMQGRADQLEARLSVAEAGENGEENARETLRLYEEYATLVSEQLDTLNQLMRTESDPAKKSQLQALALEKAEKRNELLASAAAVEEEVTAYDQQQARLEEARSNATVKSLPRDTTALSETQFAAQYLQLSEEYDREGFVALQAQVQALSGGEREEEEKQLLRNWLIAVQNEEARLLSSFASAGPGQTEGLVEKLNLLRADKASLRARLSGSPEALAAIPKAGTLPTASLNPAAYIVLTAPALEEKETEAKKAERNADDVRDELEAAEKKLEGTKKKKDREEIEMQVRELRQNLYYAETIERRLKDQEQSLATMDSRLLSVPRDEPTPADIEAEKARNLETEAKRLQQDATDLRNEANVTKKRKVREALIIQADSIEARANARLEEAEMARAFAQRTDTLEQRIIETNYLVVPGREVEIPEVTEGLNPAEKDDVSRTTEFQVFNKKYVQAAVSYREARVLQGQANQFRRQAASLMQQSIAARPDSIATPESDALALQASVLYNRADSIDERAQYLVRKGAYIENEANGYLMALPEQAYTNILAFYTGGPAVDTVAENTEAVAVATGAEVPVEGALTEPVVERGPLEEPVAVTDEPVVPEPVQQDLPEAVTGQDTTEISQETDLLATERPINLNAPVVDNERAQVVPDVLTATIFDIDREATQSVYSKENPIPVDTKMPSGLYYKIQIGAFRNPIDQDAFVGLKPITGETTPAGYTRYTVGYFEKFENAEFVLDDVKGIGYPDAFIVAYRNGKRISIDEARALEESGGVSAPVTETQVPQPVETPEAPPEQRLVKTGDMQILDIENNQDLFYTVQVGVFSKPVTSAEIENITPLNQENLPNGTFRYSTGVYPSEALATEAKQEVVALGITDAFVTAYFEGKRITLAEAREIGGGAAPTTGATQNQAEAPASEHEVARYRVLLGTFTGEVPLELAGYILQLSSQGIVKETDAEGNRKYFLGNFETQAEAQNKLNEVKGYGFEDAEVVLY